MIILRGLNLVLKLKKKKLITHVCFSCNHLTELSYVVVVQVLQGKDIQHGLQKH